MTQRALIVDDEPAARRVLRTMLARHQHLFVSIAEASNGVDAVALINSEKPDLVFMDIQMPGFTGFEVLQQLSFHPNIIFTTAYEEYALKAFETFSVDYLLKPIRQERLDIAIQKWQQFGRLGSASYADLRLMTQQLSQKKPSAFPIRLGDRILLFRYETISHFEAADKYVEMITVEGKKYLTDHTLNELMQRLPDNFIRVQKSFIINKDKIREVHKHFNGRFVMVMDDREGSRLISGLTYYEAIKREFGL
jgi:two-component system LytT family response regulator